MNVYLHLWSNILIFHPPLLTYPLRFPHENDVQFSSTSSCLYEVACLIYVIYVCLCIVVYDTYCVAFCLFYFFFFSSCCQFFFSLCCQFLWNANFLLPLRYSLKFIGTLYLMKCTCVFRLVRLSIN
jgi:hypothetical protein